MTAKTFDKFDDALKYMKSIAKKDNTTYQMIRKGNSWEVCPHLFKKNTKKEKNYHPIKGGYSWRKKTLENKEKEAIAGDELGGKSQLQKRTQSVRRQIKRVIDNKSFQAKAWHRTTQANEKAIKERKLAIIKEKEAEEAAKQLEEHREIKRLRAKANLQKAKDESEIYFKERNIRQAHLKERYEYYDTLGFEDLMGIWETEIHDDDERLVIKAAIKRKDSILSNDLPITIICRKCGVVGKCTCS